MATADPGGTQMRQAPATVEECEAQLEEVRREAEDLKDKYLRVAAQVENARKAAERNSQARATESKRDLYRRLLEVSDNLERALAQAPEGDPLSQGVQLTLRQLERLLAQEGVRRVEVEPGQPFDPVYEEAVEVRPGNVQQDTVGGIVQPGYMHEDVLLRPARVIVIRPAQR